MGFFDLLGTLFGYILWFFFDATSNYALAITLFVIVINIFMFPLAIKRQKTMASQSRLAGKQKELQKKYGKNRQKLAEEQAKLYEQEGVNPLNGCFLTMILPIVLWGGIFGAVARPLQNTLHISQEKISAAVDVVSSEHDMSNVPANYAQLHLVRIFDNIKEKLTMFSDDELADIKEYSSGFKFLGLDLLDIPKNTQFKDMMWIIPLMTFIVSAFSAFITQKLSGTADQVQGAMKFLPYFTFIFMAYFAYTIPGAVGFYWILNTLVSMLQSVLLNRFFNARTLNAKDEAVRFITIQEHDKMVEQIRNPADVIVPESNVVPFLKKFSKKESKKK